MRTLATPRDRDLLDHEFNHAFVIISCSTDSGWASGDNALMLEYKVTVEATARTDHDHDATNRSEFLQRK